LNAICNRTRIPEQYSTCSGILPKALFTQGAAQFCSARAVSRASDARKRAAKAIYTFSQTADYLNHLVPKNISFLIQASGFIKE
jgi:hypothetical protein